MTSVLLGNLIGGVATLVYLALAIPFSLWMDNITGIDGRKIYFGMIVLGIVFWLALGVIALLLGL